MTRPLRPCNQVGCTQLVRPPERYCEAHRREQRRERDRRADTERGSAASRGYDARWRKARTMYLRQHPLCWDCEAAGRVVPATVVDHVIPHEGDEQLFWAVENWQPLCESCHNRKTAREADGLHLLLYPRDIRGSSRAVTLVAGPPGSGKSSYAQQRAGTDDVVLDLDQILAELSGLPLYQAGREWLTSALERRNQRLRELVASPGSGHVWLIAGSPRPAERWFWQARLGAEVVLLAVPADECKRRIQADPRRAAVREEHLRAVDDWWRAYRPAPALLTAPG